MFIGVNISEVICFFYVGKALIFDSKGEIPVIYYCLYKLAGTYLNLYHIKFASQLFFFF